jgi:RIO kinase 1
MLWRLAAAGVNVPRTFTFFEGVLLMELIINNDGDIAPRLYDLQLTADQACIYHEILIKEVVRMLCAGIVHGDLSPYNILIGSQGPVVIDLPQAINATKNMNVCRMIKRDVDNLTHYFSQFMPQLADTDYGSEIWLLYQQGKLHKEVNLTGHVQRHKRPVDIANVLQIVNAVLRKEEALQSYKQATSQHYKQERIENHFLSRH